MQPRTLLRHRTIGQGVADNEELTRKLTIPTLAVGGTSWGRAGEVATSLRQMAEQVEELVLDECGHWVPEEKPVELANALRSFIS